MIDSRDFIADRCKVEIEPLMPAGPKIVFTDVVGEDDHGRSWGTLYKARARHPDMMLIHGASPRDVEKIAALRADNRHVTQIVFRPDFWDPPQEPPPASSATTRCSKRSPSASSPSFPGSGTSKNPADKASKLGIRFCKFNDSSAR